jgi:large subunit ribosomal protein L22
MEVKAIAKFVRYTPRKVNQVLLLIKNKKVDKALEILSFLPKSAAVLVGKVLKSAIANSNRVENFSEFKVKEAWVGNGPILKRIRHGPRGRSMPVKKRTAHLTVVITDVNVQKQDKKFRKGIKNGA